MAVVSGSRTLIDDDNIAGFRVIFTDLFQVLMAAFGVTGHRAGKPTHVGRYLVTSLIQG